MELWKRQNEQVRLIGGLLVIGSARHDSMRVDTQLRGRAGRQGDPGESQFIVSLEDDLFRVYAQSGLLAMIDKMNLMPLGSALQSPLIEKGLNRAQKAVEDHQFSLRKQLLSFDQVGAQQRAVLYQWRNEVLSQSLSLQNLYDMFEALFITEYVDG
jgi:preprotein translocase subunit SecA